MSKPKVILTGICAAMLAAALPTRGASQDLKKSEPGKATEASDSVGRYCANIAPVAIEARIAWQMKRLNELDAQIKRRIAELDVKEAEARDWVSKREDMLKKASDDIVAIYSKMQPEAASAQLIAMDDISAAAILSKLNPRAASAILNEMDAARAAKLTDLISGAAKSASAAAPAPEPQPADAQPAPADGSKS
ncbi:MAG TPA: MotE family protein [Roseiarcus sp.]|nr:MotE family protein [Roseiarcus sp.]